jgi:cation diffusion facilitator family transporter
MSDSHRRGIRAAQAGLLINAVLASIKLVAGILGNSYALIADAIESTADVFSSLAVWGGLRIAAQPADENHPYGHGKAEPLAAAVVGLVMLGAATGVAIEALREILIPHKTPAPFTLAVLVGVVAVKELLFRRVYSLSGETGSRAVSADAWHHRSDALTSAAAFVGIAIALWGGPGWESADDWAALVASVVITMNAMHVLRPAVHDLMDRAPDQALLAQIAEVMSAVDDVRAIEKLKVRRAGVGFYVDVHVQADPEMSLRDAHVLSGRVKGAVCRTIPSVLGVLVHMEPYHPAVLGEPVA